jgi:hypothetical protein
LTGQREGSFSVFFGFSLREAQTSSHNRGYSNMEIWKKLLGYITFKKADPNSPSSFNLRMMHGINKISILMFLAGMIYLIVRAIMR